MIGHAPETKEMQILTAFLRQQDPSLDPARMIQAMEWTVTAMRPIAPLAPVDPWEIVNDLRRLRMTVADLRVSLAAADAPLNEVNVAPGRAGSRVGWSMPSFPTAVPSPLVPAG